MTRRAFWRAVSATARARIAEIEARQQMLARLAEATETGTVGVSQREAHDIADDLELLLAILKEKKA